MNHLAKAIELIEEGKAADAVAYYLKPILDRVELMEHADPMDRTQEAAHYHWMDEQIERVTAERDELKRRLGEGPARVQELQRQLDDAQQRLDAALTEQRRNLAAMHDETNAAPPVEREVTVRELLAWAKAQPACPGFGQTIENIEQLTEEFLTEKGAY